MINCTFIFHTTNIFGCFCSGIMIQFKLNYQMIQDDIVMLHPSFWRCDQFMSTWNDFWTGFQRILKSMAHWVSGQSKKRPRTIENHCQRLCFGGELRFETQRKKFVLGQHAGDTGWWGGCKGDTLKTLTRSSSLLVFVSDCYKM